MPVDLLFADPDEVLRDCHRRYFSRHGLVVDTAANGLECREKLRSTDPLFLIMDKDLPPGGADGGLALLLQEDTFLQVPVVIVTGTGSPSEIAEQTRLPASCCVTKPYGLNVLLEKIRAAASRNIVNAESDRNSTLPDVDRWRVPALCERQHDLQ